MLISVSCIHTYVHAPSGHPRNVKEHTSICAFACVHIHIHIHVYGKCVCVYTNTYIYIYIYTYTCINIYIYINKIIYAYIHTYMQTYIHTCKHMHAYVYMCAQFVFHRRRIGTLRPCPQCSPCHDQSHGCIEQAGRGPTTIIIVISVAAWPPPS